MRYKFSAPEGEVPYAIDAAELNLELTEALGVDGWKASHAPWCAVVELDDETKADIVQRVVEDHIANTAKREHNKAVLAGITALEASVTQRMLREAALGDSTRLAAVNSQIAALRASFS